MSVVEFRSGIAQIEMFQNATAEELLAALQTLVKSSDVGHNFPPISNGAMDVDLKSNCTHGLYGSSSQFVDRNDGDRLSAQLLDCCS